MNKTTIDQIKKKHYLVNILSDEDFEYKDENNIWHYVKNGKEIVKSSLLFSFPKGVEYLTENGKIKTIKRGGKKCK